MSRSANNLTHLALIIIVLFGDNLRFAGGLPYLLSVALCLPALYIYTLKHQRYDAVGFAAVIIIYVFLSYQQIMPKAWTTMFSKDVILTQAAPLLSFVVLLVSFEGYILSCLERGILQVRLSHLFLAFAAGSPLIDLPLGMGISSRFLGSLRNGSLIALCFLLFSGRTQGVVWRALLVSIGLTVAAFGNYVQTRIIYAAAAMYPSVYWTKLRLGRLMALSAITLLIVATYVGLGQVADVFSLDPNTGWRLAFWRDVLRALNLTHGAGVGFGTEALSNYYADLVQQKFKVDLQNTPDFILIGTHNAFMDTMLRMGIPGLIPMIIVFLRPLHLRSSKGLTTDAGIIYIGSFLCAYTNVGLQSPLYSAGIAFGLSYCRCVGNTVATNPRLFRQSRLDSSTR